MFYTIENVVDKGTEWEETFYLTKKSVTGEHWYSSHDGLNEETCFRTKASAKRALTAYLKLYWAEGEYEVLEASPITDGHGGFYGYLYRRKERVFVDDYDMGVKQD